MPQISRQTAIQLFRFYWTDIPNLFVPDKKYHLLEDREINWLSLVNDFHKCEGIKEISDCDNFSLIFHAFIRQEQYRERWPLPWAVGEIAVKSDGGNHALNFLVSHEAKIYFLDVKMRHTWPASVGSVSPYFIRM